MARSIFILGNPQSIKDQAATSLKNQPALLLARLLVEPGVVDRASLATMLYPQSKNPRGNLAATLRLLQRQIGYDTIDAKRSTLAIHRDGALQVDIWTWDTLDSQIRKLLYSADQNHLLPIQQLENMLALYRGEFLAGTKSSNNIAVSNWLTTERERYRQTFIARAEQLIQFYEIHRMSDKALSFVKRALEHEPHHESFQLTYMRLLRDNGRVDEAINWGRQMRRRLQSELAMVPSNTFSEMMGQLRRDGAHKPADVLIESEKPRFDAPKIQKSIFGRIDEARQIATRLLTNQTRLISLVGLGGIGKTTLAMSVADIVAPLTANGVCWASFTDEDNVENAATAEQQIAHKIAQKLQMPIEKNLADIPSQLIENLARYDLLLVLDNFEQVAAGSAYIRTILDNTSRIRILITSRSTPPNLSGSMRPVMGLSPPQSADKENACIRLFVERAKIYLPAFRLQENNAQAIVKICQLTGGVPLAIELAASRVPLFQLTEIAVALETQLDFLTNPFDDANNRRQSVTAVLEYSWSDLPIDQQVLIYKLTIFKGEFRRQAAEAICGATSAQLASLIRRALIQAHTPGWLSLHPLIRTFARQKRSQPVSYDALEHAYFDYFLDLLSTGDSPWNELETRRTMHTEKWSMQHGDLINAWQLGVKHHAVAKLRDATLGISVYGAMLDTPGIIVELFKKLRQQLLSQSPLSNEHQQLVARLGLYICRYGDAIQQNSADVISMLEQSVALCEAIDSAEWMTFAKFRLMITLFNWGRGADALTHMRPLLKTLRSSQMRVATRRTTLAIIRIASSGGSRDDIIPDWRTQLHFQHQHELEEAIVVNWTNLAVRELSNHVSLDILLGYVAHVVAIYEQQPHLVTGIEHRALLNVYGNYLMQSGDWNTARETYQKLGTLYNKINARQYDTRRFVYEINYASLLAQTGEYIQAILMLERFIARDDDRSQFLRGAARNSLATIYHTLGYHELAIQQLFIALGFMVKTHFQSGAMISSMFLLTSFTSQPIPQDLLNQILAVTVHAPGTFTELRKEAQQLLTEASTDNTPFDASLLGEEALRQMAQQLLSQFDLAEVSGFS